MGGMLVAAPALTVAAPYDLVTSPADRADGAKFLFGVRASQDDPQTATGFGIGRYGIGFSGNAEAWPASYDAWLRRAAADEAPAIVSLTPGLAYRPASSNLSLGAALDLRYRLTPGAPAGLPAYRDGQATGEAGLRGVGLNLGMHYSLDQRTDVGLVYRSQLRQDPYLTRYSIARYSDLDSGMIVPSGLAVPQTVSASIQRQLGARWALTGALGWQEWASDTDPLGTRVVGLNTRGGDAWFAGVGAQYRLRQNLDVGMAVEYLYGNGLDTTRRNLTRTDVPGSDAGYYFFGLDLKWKF
jgi:long-chain fatty acid transport protein